MCADIRAQQTKAVQHAGFSVGNSRKANGLHSGVSPDAQVHSVEIAGVAVFAMKRQGKAQAAAYAKDER